MTVKQAEELLALAITGNDPYAARACEIAPALAQAILDMQALVTAAEERANDMAVEIARLRALLGAANGAPKKTAVSTIEGGIRHISATLKQPESRDGEET